MFWLSNKLIWIPFYIWLLYLVIKNFKKQSYVIIGSVVILIILTDQISNHLFKDIFQRLRPCHELGDKVHLVFNYCGGQYGFISSHATNCFGLATFVSLLLYKKFNFILLVMFFWAFAVSYSRIYLGQHFPGDVLGGGLCGCLLGFLMFRLNAVLVKKNKIIVE